MGNSAESRIVRELRALADADYKEFNAKLIPTVKKERVIGVRTPALRMYAKRFFRTEQATEFLRALPHVYHEENLLHAFLIEQIKDSCECLDEIEKFLPYIDNWAVCDQLAPGCLSRAKEELLGRIRKWSRSNQPYTVRFAIGMLMRYYLDEDFDPAYLAIPIEANTGTYYTDMMTAWFFATALAKQYDAVLPVLTERRLASHVHNKTIQKARESRRIAPDQKEYLNTLKIKNARPFGKPE